MLREIKSVRQISGEPNRRWFNDDDMDLIVWHKGNSILGFQLCYDKLKEEKAISWKPETGLVHEKVDNGESRDGHYKSTPILIENGSYDIETIKAVFSPCSVNINDDSVRAFVLEHLNK